MPSFDARRPRAALLAGVIVGFATVAAASTNFLQAGQVVEGDVEAALRSELTAAGGGGGRLARLEDTFRSMYVSLPKNAEGRLTHQAVRYALHRFFVHRYGWFIRGLEPTNETWHASPNPAAHSSKALKEWVPSYLQDILELQLTHDGTDLKELAAMAAVLEDLIRREAVGRLENAYDIHGTSKAALLEEEQAEEVIGTYYVSFLLAGNFSAASATEVERKKRIFASKYAGWPEAEEWLRDLTSKQLTVREKEAMDFQAATRLVAAIGEEYFHFNDLECTDLKSTLRGMEAKKPGRVRLSSFYNKALYSHWRFTEKADYLRTLGALDESDPKQPFVIITNYAMARPNCLDASNLYAICCRNECEELMGHLEGQIGTSSATPSRIAGLVSELRSATVEAPRNLSATLLARLQEVADHHGGEVPLHGRLFAQWMHHAYPLECPYPHELGTINPQTPDEWIKETGHENERASAEEMLQHVEQDVCAVTSQGKIACEGETADLPWTPKEELLTAANPFQQRPAVQRLVESTPAPEAADGVPGLGLAGAALLAAAVLAAVALGRSRVLHRAFKANREDEDDAGAAAWWAAHLPEVAWKPIAASAVLATIMYALDLLDSVVVLYAVGCGCIALVVRTAGAGLVSSRARRASDVAAVAAAQAKCCV